MNWLILSANRIWLKWQIWNVDRSGNAKYIRTVKQTNTQEEAVDWDGSKKAVCKKDSRKISSNWSLAIFLEVSCRNSNFFLFVKGGTSFFRQNVGVHFYFIWAPSTKGKGLYYNLHLVICILYFVFNFDWLWKLILSWFWSL